MVPRVLIIEPYPDLREVIALTLRREHYPCDAVADVQEAAHEIGRRNYAFVLVDGETTGAAVASLDPDAHVVSLVKPFGRSELLAAVR
jgi:DNA-binding response OmpR family regulator